MRGGGLVGGGGGVAGAPVEINSADSRHQLVISALPLLLSSSRRGGLSQLYFDDAVAARSYGLPAATAAAHSNRCQAPAYSAGAAPS